MNPAFQGAVFQLETERPVTRDVLMKVLPGESKAAREKGKSGHRDVGSVMLLE